MGEICDEQNEENARRMQHPDQKDALAGRIVPHKGDEHKGSQSPTAGPSALSLAEWTARRHGNGLQGP
jgi:hypothetical protein